LILLLFEQVLEGEEGKKDKKFNNELFLSFQEVFSSKRFLSFQRGLSLSEGAIYPKEKKEKKRKAGKNKSYLASPLPPSMIIV